MTEFNDILKLMQRHLKRDQGLFIGEIHSEPFARTVLIENMEALHKTGVRTVYLELTQETVDALRAGGADCALLSVRKHGLEQYTNAPDEVVATDTMRRSGDLYTHIIQRADQLGMQVIGYDVFNERTDTSAALTAAGMTRRDREGAEIIKNTHGDDKYIVLGGSAHSRTAHSLKNIPSPGLDQRLGIAAIDFSPASGASYHHPDMRLKGISQDGPYAIVPAKKSADHVVLHTTDYADERISHPHEPQVVRRISRGSLSSDIEISKAGADLLANGLCRGPDNEPPMFKSADEQRALIARFAPAKEGPAR